jgi:3D-(3,5/4)-trihydroxycyclohexane-1,2-dione acylhydrolase (decyclizing)
VYPEDGVLVGDEPGREARPLPLDLALTARGIGAHVIECATYADVAAALEVARGIDRTTVIYVRTDRLEGVPGYESWWDVPVAEVSEQESVREARRAWEAMRAKERDYL